ncbi:MAG: hypothetical protein Unbinned6242contig1001_4 [Prokaryotic dsDNA virus sp.]|nr:MAG: hypothetical protein Unbinned6242contig1001_4 [Prokaryotic dsDNA virus sp.]|tara:strand:+ start:13182 stop:13493 length:312 start_codon:yes stop_codon:yes gene_type:complete
MDDFSTLIETLGFPIAITVGLLGALFSLIRWMASNVVGQIIGKLDQVQLENKEAEDESKGILIKLIDRIRALQTDVIRLDTMFRIKHKLPVDERRIERNQKED